MNAIETIELGDYTVEVFQDDNPDNPRNWDNIGTMVCFHGRYTLGDKHSFGSPDDFLEWWKKNGKGGVLLSLYLYDHSGITMSASSSGNPFSCPWDSGQVGWIYATKETILKEYGEEGKNRITVSMKKKATHYLLNEVKVYDQYLTGEVYGYRVKDKNGEDIEGGCWGFYGYDHEKSGLLEAAKEDIAGDKRQKADKLKTWIKNRVPLERRVYA
mgnify:CR=1 FL=1